MNKSLKRFSVLTFLFLWVNLHFAYSQQRSDELMKQDLARANALITSYRNDTAKIVIGKLMAEVKKQKQLDSPFGLKVQLAKAISLEHDDLDSSAMQLLLQVKEWAKQKKIWDVFTQTCIALAHLYENISQSSQSLEHLQLAQNTIRLNKLDSLYPLFAVRMSSYQRIFPRDKDSSLFYAKEALRTAPKFKLDIAEATAHMLLGMLLEKTSYEKALWHCLAALRLFQKLEDYTESAAMCYNISSLNYQYNKFKQALAYNDSSITLAKKAIIKGHEGSHSLYKGYKFRGIIFKALGQADSAWFYLKKGYEMELNYNQKIENHKIIEVAARYNDEKKTIQIAEQIQQRNNILTIGLLIILFTATLSYYYLKLRQANEITQKQETQLRMLDIAKSQFFANVSHEIRTPLTLIHGSINLLLKENQLTEKQSKLLKAANINSKQLHKMVNEILDLRKLEMGKMVLKTEPTLIASFFRTHIQQFESFAESKQIKLLSNINIGNEIIAEIDKEKCRQVIYNLLSNACKYTTSGGKITVDVLLENEQLTLNVADTGSGIHPDDLPLIFDRFFQSNRKEQLYAGGTGIGLSLCQDYAALFDGKLYAESELGKGSIFYFSFPILLIEQDNLSKFALADNEFIQFSEINNEAENSINASITALSSTKPTILVVEDNVGLQEYITMVLEEKYNIITAENGQIALEKLTNSPAKIDLILSDLMMPVMDGFKLLEKLKAENSTRHIPVIMLTARAETTDKLKALRIGVDDYLLKPFDEEELNVRIDNLLQNLSIRKLEIENQNTEPLQAITYEEDRLWLENFEQFIKKNIADELLSIPAIGNEFAMSESTLLRTLKRLTGLSPIQYLQEIRMNEARGLLENRIFKSVAIVAKKVGFSDSKTFSRSFKKRFGKLPSDLI